MRLIIFCIGLFLAGTLITCSPKFSFRFANQNDLISLTEKSNPLAQLRRTSCDTSEYYAPDTLHLDHTPIREIKVNFHFMNSSDLENNVPRDEQYKYARDILWVLNKSLEKNMKMFIPPGNNTPALPIQYRYKLWPNKNDPNDDGVHEHIDDGLYFFVKSGKYRNNSDRSVIQKYAIQEDSVLNIFCIPHHPDSVISKKYRADHSGIALGNSVKVGAVWKNKPDPWSLRGIMNHEMGHVLGLSHTWNSNDGCDDTPKNPNCYNFGEPPCDSMASNNMMDYNAHQAALSPCQLGKIAKNIAREGSRQRNITVPDWCTLDEKKSITINENMHWYGAKDLSGHLYISTGASLTVHCRLSMPATAKIVIEPGGKLILDNARVHNACGDEWTGIELQKLGNLEGQIITSGSYSIENAKNTIDSVE